MPLLAREKQAAKIALHRLGREGTFLGGPLDEAAVVVVFAKVDGGAVHPLATAKAKREAAALRAGILRQAREAILAAIDGEGVQVAALDELRGRGRSNGLLLLSH